MIEKHTSIKLCKLALILIGLIISVVFLYKTMSKYESNSTSTGNIEVAFYILNETYQNMNLNLSTLRPQNEPYVYTFTIANNNGTNRTDTNLEYDLSIKTTTNLPLTYELYLNENYNDNGATNIITSNLITPDEDGTYFREIETQTRNFGFQTNQTDTYNLVIYFPITYKSIAYQNIIEGIEIMVDSTQIIE